jgi:hypothetical protein
MQALQKARDTALQGLNGVETTAKQGAYANRNAADVVNAQNVQKLREAMANMGLSSSGDSITGQIGLATARQSAMNDINQGEQNTLKDVSERRALINNNAAGDEAALINQLNAAKANMLLNQFNQDRSYGLDLAGLSGQLPGGGMTLAAQGQLFNQNMANQQFDYNKTVDQRNFDFQKAQQDWENNFRTGQFDWQKAQQSWENAFKEKDFQQQVKQFASQMGYNWASLNQRQQEAIADQAFRKKSFQLQQDQFDYSKDPNNPDNIYKNTQIDALKWDINPLNPKNLPASEKPQTAEDYAKYIDSSPYLGKDFNGNTVVTDKTSLEKMILQSGLSSSELAKLYTRYGIPMK